MAHTWHKLVPTRADSRPTVIPMEPSRASWNDERLDEFAERTEQNFREVRAEIRGLETHLRGEMDQRFDRVEGRFDRVERRFDLMFGAMITGVVGLIVTHFVA